MLEKTVRMNSLFDFYQPLLTNKQRLYLERYYLDDFSLGEISEEFNVSRQAVYDNIRRTETMLEEYEEKLGLYKKYQERLALYEQLKALAPGDFAGKAQLLEAVETLEKLEEEGVS
ncbi:putative DNA-binding protein [Marinococcus sp. PL1-022]|uniref:putative DNA-binding protein n=1 Tax=Marinococcus sp. PL1-022 TaxID=3095363 RepID=UPI0029C3B4BB|nr:putative DNA-binding protein [Marinococcus sp. PL1-022]MDX6152438.1 putative DNA-binding protein [Marinococcus sp. PL1-022]